ncbi:MAG: FumA C-terminus/TtdB family hydratase beta subunit [Alphaproteobacteria bacterium]|nr:FumA C-terminus/TtdB family hydratase beta subunit [Alphaproteobacteria bacterium]
MNDFSYLPIFDYGKDDTDYRKLDDAGLQKINQSNIDGLDGKNIYQLDEKLLSLLACEAFKDINHYLRPAHLQQVADILDDDEASPNDRYVAYDLLKNANIAAAGILPMCQDTGTALIMGKKGKNIISFDDESMLARGVYDAYQQGNLRYSQLSPISMFEEKNTRDNLPAQIEIFSEGIDEYNFLFIAKGGGSANKSFLFQGAPSLLDPERLLQYLDKKIRTLGTAACPPYHLAIVIGGTSGEFTLKTAKLASCHYLDNLPITGGTDAQAFRDKDMEQQVLAMTQNMGIGAQFGGKYYCHDVRVVRLPRHGASLPIALAVSCSADRQVKGKITPQGVFLEQLEHEPAKYLPDLDEAEFSANEVKIDLSENMADILQKLTQYPIKTRLSLTGTIIVARDAAHLKLQKILRETGDLPEYFKNHPIYYAGPAKKPEGMASGSFGPTTAGRMDSFVDEFQQVGGSMIMLAKGNRSKIVTAACHKNGGFYLGSIGGAAARLAQDCIKKIEVLEFEELGMEAVWRIEVENFPAFIIIDDKGNDFFADILK